MTAAPVPQLHLDTGVLVALDRSDRETWSVVRDATDRGVRPRISAPVLAQAWRSPRQARLAQALQLCDVIPTTAALARRAGRLCAMAGTSDAVDAIVVATAAVRGGVVLTSDPDDIGTLATHVGRVTVAPL